MSDCCLAALVKHGNDIFDAATLLEFLEPWNGVEEYCDEILVCLRKTSSRAHSQAESGQYPEGMPTDVERKATLQAARLSKKLKDMDDLHGRSPSNAATKARVKKAREASEKAAAAAKAKSGTKSGALDVRKLALANSQ
ncbi:hypothetical protein MMC07_009736 [Pseudocyphellaria aurata]|nr:hypothetical protein [Pseudocyphellaria aurata]